MKGGTCSPYLGQERVVLALEPHWEGVTSWWWLTERVWRKGGEVALPGALSASPAQPMVWEHHPAFSFCSFKALDGYCKLKKSSLLCVKKGTLTFVCLLYEAEEFKLLGDLFNIWLSSPLKLFKLILGKIAITWVCAYWFFRMCNKAKLSTLLES